ncbi:MAG: methyltransferase domain-containing protein [Deltaproteobacteria bacterium]|nr:methyltransferase domain-containing protein [Deltaproteobacteria bacterium]
MAVRSIPFYQEVQSCITAWAEAYSKEESTIYDIGCSTGTTLALLCQDIPWHLDLIGVDSSQAMLDNAEAKLAPFRIKNRVSLQCQNALDMKFQDASMIICNFTLQFIPVRERFTLLQKIFSGLKSGGLLFLSEKIRSAVPAFQETQTYIYESFKRKNGYSQNEIERKKESLDNVLVPLTLTEQYDLLERAGFSTVDIVLKWHSFVSIVALK